jgi:hypothetical protein
MSIRSNIEAIMSQIQGGDTDLAHEIQAQAVAAIKAGQGSDEWETYMGRFAADSTQMSRLLGTDSTQNDFNMDIARTSLVGNGTCGATSTGIILGDIGDTLDENL